jgi:hypothetical protein
MQALGGGAPVANSICRKRAHKDRKENSWSGFMRFLIKQNMPFVFRPTLP